MKKKYLTILILGAACVAVAGDGGFEPYQPIIERMPFGRPVAAFNPDDPTNPLPSKDGEDESAEPAVDLEQEKIAERICATVRVCALNVPPDGVPVVGFTDSAHTPPRNHLLAQGQTADGWTVLEIDPASSCVVLEREGVAVNLRLGGGLKTSPSPSRKSVKTSRKSRKTRKSKSRS
jgi:hypothetical protein